MLTRRNSILLTAKGLAALIASGPFLTGCTDEKRGSSFGEGRLNIDAQSRTASDGWSARALDTRTQAGARQADTREATPDTIRPESPRADVDGPENTLPANTNLTWEAFLSELAMLAEEQFSPEWNQAAYVEDVGALMQLLDLQDNQFQALYDGYATATSSFPELQTVHEGGYFEVATLEFDPGDTIDLHNHPDMTGVILCLSGTLKVEAFDLLEDISDSGALLLQRVVNREVNAGEYCTLTATHGNIHSVSAPVFTQLLDVFTPPYDEERLKRYRWYERAPLPYSGDDIFEAWEV